MPKLRCAAGRRCTRSWRRSIRSPRARIHPNDAQRIQRALEVHRLTGKTLERAAARAAGELADLTFVAYALVPGDRERLYAAIEAALPRDDARGSARGSAQAPRARRPACGLPAIRAVGYRQLWEHLSGRDALDFAIQRAIFATRQLARRQMIWLRAEPGHQWLDALDSGAGAHMEHAITQLGNSRRLR